MTKKRMLFLLGFVVLIGIAPVAYQIDRAAQSLPTLHGTINLKGLNQAASVSFDTLAVPTIQAESRENAYRILGYLHARDRLFQMDMLRRKSEGTLAEVLGEKALPIDRKQRTYGFRQVAVAAIDRLTESERTVLAAYSDGINRYIETAHEFPPEFRLLHYRPAPWVPADSLMVGSTMFQTLSDQEQDERMLTVMQACLPAEVTAFLTPDTDDFTHVLSGGQESRRPQRPVPTQALQKLLSEARTDAPHAALVNPEATSLGSNNWAINASKTDDGRAILADDMHLPLGVPNIWYRAQLKYQGSEISGISLPGLPLIIAGHNQQVAWGFTNLNGDVQDLIRLQLNPHNPNEYQTPEGWRRFDTHPETIRIRDGQALQIELRSTLWGPVLDQNLLGTPVALRWTALDPAAINLRLIDMDSARNIQTAMQTLHRFGAPPQNVVLADAQGHIGWTLTGFVPLRQGMDGSLSQSGARQGIGWNGYIPPDQLPTVIDPPEGYIATANNRILGLSYPHVVGHNFANGYRAYRIREQLAEKTTLTEQEMHQIQLDTRSEFYEFYRQLALSILTPDRLAMNPDLTEIDSAIRQWNGHMDPDSHGIALLARWRTDLAKAIFTPLLSRCANTEPGFSYQWRNMETPLRALIKQADPTLAPDHQPGGWQEFLLKSLVQTSHDLKSRYQTTQLDMLTWQHANTVLIQHPFSRSTPWASPLLDMKPIPGACDSNCLKVLHDRNGASVRLVVSPGHPEDGILEMPGGQSGHPLSPHFRDQQNAWQTGAGPAFQAGKAVHTLKFMPEKATSNEKMPAHANPESKATEN